MSVFKGILENMLEKDFKIIKGFYDSETIDENSKFVGLYKMEGAMLYEVVILNCNADDDVEKSISEYRKNCVAIAKKLGFNCMTCVSILVSDSSETLIELKDLCNIKSFENDGVMEVRWIVDAQTNQLLILGNQPSKLAGIDFAIHKALGTKTSAEKETLSDLIEESIEKHKLYIRSEGFGVTISIILVNMLLFLSLEWMGGSRSIDALVSFGAIEINRIFQNSEYYRLFSYMFLHIGLSHLLSNAIALYVFGSRVERYMGKLRFLMIYILSGIGGGVLAMYCSDGVCAGASGAIFGLIGATIVYCRVKGIRMDGFDFYLILIITLVSIAGGFLFTNVSNAGHIGGLCVGMLVSYLILPKDKQIDLSQISI